MNPVPPLDPEVLRALSAAYLVPTHVSRKRDILALVEKLHPLACETGLIRLGPAGDGGYLVPDDLAGLRACFSPGVGEVSGFERACADLGMGVFLADRSVDAPRAAHPSFHFTKKYVGAFDDEEFMTLERWVADSIDDRCADLLLQIDIEGYEYEVFLAAPERLLRRFRIIVAEFHWLDQFWNRPFFQLASRALDKLLVTHACVHIHPNNYFPVLSRHGLHIPPLLEFTFLRRDRLRPAGYQATFPHPLDSDNTTNPTVVLPKCWYGGGAPPAQPPIASR